MIQVCGECHGDGDERPFVRVALRGMIVYLCRSCWEKRRWIDDLAEIKEEETST
jgi:hypothetical protein